MNLTIVLYAVKSRISSDKFQLLMGVGTRNFTVSKASAYNWFCECNKIEQTRPLKKYVGRLLDIVWINFFNRKIPADLFKNNVTLEIL